MKYITFKSGLQWKTYQSQLLKWYDKIYISCKMKYYSIMVFSIMT